ncbi:hypothetical protein [Melissospora conviva]|uniref:hypothetical protein n=1 Tax=Melissospora conviva TaxID=3388432 RepID=UPI003C255F57
MSTRTDSMPVTQAVHDLGSALWFGGATMGVVGVNSAGRDLEQGVDRIRVASSAWRRFGLLEWAGIGATLIAGAQLTRSSRRRIGLQQGYGTVGGVKAGLAVAGALATGYAAYCGMRIGAEAERARREEEPIEVTDATTPNSRTPARIAKWQRRQRIAQYAVPLLAGANIAAGSKLVQSYRPIESSKGVLKRIIPGL